MKSYDSIKRIGHTQNNDILESDDDALFVQEKLDGANFRFTLQRHIEDEYHDDDRNLVFGSRNVVYKNERDVDSNFHHALDWVRERAVIEEVRRLDNLYGPLIFFGEAMHPHTLEYDWDNTPSFIGFDVYSEKFDEFAHPEETEWFYNEIGLDHTPFVSLKTDNNGDFVIPESKYRDGLAEGIVIKNTETNQFAKVRSEQFKEMHDSAGGTTSEKHEPEESVILAHQFATEARIEKMIHKYENRGKKMGMHQMKDLWRDVFDDIISEEYETIFLENHTINTKNFRSEVASITATVLQQYLNRPDESVLNKIPT